MVVLFKFFFFYVEVDEDFKKWFDNYLIVLKWGNLIDLWSDEQVLAGYDWGVEIKCNIQDVDIVLLFVSVSFIVLEYIWKLEVEKVMVCCREGVIVVFVVFKFVDWEGLFFVGFQGLFCFGKFVMIYDDLDLGLLEVVKGV